MNMSDIFNVSENKEAIAKILLKPTPKGKTEDITRVPPWSAPTGSVDGAQTASRFLIDHKIPVYKQLAIADFEPEPTHEVFNGFPLLEVNGFLETHPYLELPVGRTEFIPSYRPSHFQSKVPDQALLNQMVYQGVYSKSDVTEEVRKIYDAAETYMYGTGTAEGQLQRLADMYDIREGNNGKFRPTGLNKVQKYIPLVVNGKEVEGRTDIVTGLEGIALILEETLPIPIPTNKTDTGAAPPLTVMPGDLIIPDEEGEPIDELPEIREKASAGMPFTNRPGVKKGEVLAESIAIADMFLKGISDILQIPVPSDLENELEKHLYDFWYMMCGLLFPKAERYERSKWTTKTRNIWSSPTPTHILLSMISDPIMRHNRINFLNFPTPSLAKFNPLAGISEVTERLTNKDEFELIYADNLYISYKDDDGDVTWYSLDLEKGEANATPEDAQAIAYYFLTRGWVDENGAPAFSKTWAYFAMNIVPMLIVDPICLMYNLQFRFPGQGSGNSWTFLINHVVTSKLWNEWRQRNRPRPASAEWTKLCQDMGVNIKVERQIDKVNLRLEETMESTPREGWLQEKDATGPASSPIPSVDLDLLGFSASYSHVLNRFVAVLDDERMWPSAAYPKKLENREFKENPDAADAYTIIRYEALRIMGAWRYPGLDESARYLAERNRGRLEKLHDLSRFSGMSTQMVEFGDALEDSPTVDLTQTMTEEKLEYIHRTRPHKIPNPTDQKFNPIRKAMDARILKSSGLSLEELYKRGTARGLLLESTRERASKFLSSMQGKIRPKEAKHETLLVTEGLQEIINIKDAMFTTARKQQFLKETRPEVAANPIASYNIKASIQSRGSLASKTQTGQTGFIRPETLSKSQKKNAKRREKDRALRGYRR